MPDIARLCIIGVGLIGGSLALALRQAGAVGSVIGVGRSAANLEEAVRLGIIDSYSHDAATAVESADMVVLAVPVGSIRPVCEQIRDHLPADAILTDVGSVKADVVEQVRAGFGELPARFVPGHPIAGTEKSGAAAAFPELYQGRRVLLTPLQETFPEALAKVRRMWESVGAEVETMTVEHHDTVLAATSHLPHMLAFGLVDSLARQQDSDEIFRYAAGGFRDFTRIASSDPVMWRDICMHNGPALLGAMSRFEEEMAELRDAIEQGDSDRLVEIFSRAKAARDKFAG